MAGETEANERKYAPSGFFALRSPLLPVDEFAGWQNDLAAPQAGEDAAKLAEALAADRARLRQYLRALVERPEVREAIFVGSPSLHERLSVWLRDPDSKSGQKVEAPLVRYILRMMTRPTPFGLFSGCTLGLAGENSELLLAAREKYRRHTRLDMDYLSLLTDALEHDPGIREHLLYRPNSSLYRAADRLRYAEARMQQRSRSHHLVAVEPTPHLERTLERARAGKRAAELAAALVADDPEITLAEAEEYIADVINSQLLVSELAPAVTGSEPMQGLVTALAAHPKGEDIAARLRSVAESIAQIDAQALGTTPEPYLAVAEQLKELPAAVELPRLFQVDMVKPAIRAVASAKLLEAVQKGAEYIARLAAAAPEDRLSSFRRAFAERYEQREVPLAEALDEEIGIGFERSRAPAAEASPLLADLILPGRTAEWPRWTGREAYLLRRLEELPEAAQELALTKDDVARLTDPTARPLPDAFAVMIAVDAASPEALAQGDFRVLIKSVMGPSGALLLGRFCHADPALAEQVRGHLQQEEALRPDAIFAEIVHLPEGRIGNILCRPVLREYEIPFLGVSGAPVERQIAVEDLLVSVEGERVVLRAARLGRDVLPRLTSAHNYSLRSLGTYRFLCALQAQESSGSLMWTWGGLEALRFLPRVTVENIVLARARWRVEAEELQEMAKLQGAALFQHVHKWRQQRRLPRFAMLADADNELLVDFDNILSLETFLDLVKQRPQLVLTEYLPDVEHSCVRGPEGKFANELIVPFIRTGTPAPARSRRAAAPGQDGRSFPPGSEWLYAKLYTGTALADQVLRDAVGPLARSVVQSGAADSWFFIRYGDPEWHLRLRIHGAPDTLTVQVLPRVLEMANRLLRQGWVSRFQLDTYERELERYGGVQGTILAERLFHADSEAVLGIVELLAGDEGADARWRLTLRGIDTLLSDFGLEIEAKRVLMAQVREAFGREFQADTTYLKYQLSDKYRKERKGIDALLDPAQDEQSLLQPGFALLRRRCEQWAPTIAELRAAEQAGQLTWPITELLRSYIHMHANRLLRSAQRAQELVLYDFLHRTYESRAARIRKGQ